MSAIKKLAVFIVISFFFTTPKVACAQNPVNPNASDDTKKVLEYLSNLPQNQSNRVLSGQMSGWFTALSTGYSQWVNSIHNQTGKWIALIGTDYAFWNGSSVNQYSQPLVDHWNQGGLVTISWHAPNPWTGGNHNDRNIGSGLREAITPGTTAYSHWINQLDQIAAALKHLDDNGVVVLWRPFHEMNGHWFWWSGRNQSDFIALWQHMFNYFTYEKGLNNLLWTFGSMSISGSWGTSELYYYPGSSYVDIFGYDWYGDDLYLGEYDQVVALGKPIGITEYGPAGVCGSEPCPNGSYDYTRLVNTIKSNYPQVTFFQSWEDVWSIAENQNAIGLMNDPWIIDRDEVSWHSVQPTTTPTPTPAPTLPPTLPPTPSIAPIKPGDANADGNVDGQDFVIWLDNYGKTDAGISDGDFNNDKKVDGKDYLIWLDNYNT